MTEAMVSRQVSEPFRPTRLVWLLTILFAVSFMYVYIYQPKPIRFLLFGIPLLTAAVFLVREIRQWVLLLPVLVTFGTGAWKFGPFYLSPATVVILLVFFAYSVHRLLGFRESIRFPLPLRLVGAAYLAQLASVFVTLHTHDSLTWNVLREGHKLFLGALLLPVVFDWYGRGEWLERFLKVLVVMLLAMTIFGIYQYTSGNLDALGELASGFDLAGRVYSTISGGPNSYSGVLELLVPVALASMFFLESRTWKTIAFITVILGILNVLYTFSRGGFLTVTFSCLAYLLYKFRSKVWVPVVSFMIFAGFVTMNAGEFQRQLTVFRDPRALMLDTSLLHRYTSYKGFIEEIGKDPVEGVGWGGSEFFHGRTALYGFWEVRHQDSVNEIERFGGLNSLVLEMPLKGGLFSSLSLLLLFGAIFGMISRLLRSGRNTTLGFGYACGLAGFSVHQLFDNLIPWPQTGAFFWIVFALLAAVAYPCCDKGKDSL